MQVRCVVRVQAHKQQLDRAGGSSTADDRGRGTQNALDLVTTLAVFEGWFLALLLLFRNVRLLSLHSVSSPSASAPPAKAAAA